MIDEKLEKIQSELESSANILFEKISGLLIHEITTT